MSPYRKRLSIDHRKKIEELLSQGKSNHMIARAIGFSAVAVSSEVSKFSKRSEYNAEMAHVMKAPSSRKKEALPVLEMLKDLEVVKKYCQLEERISAVEFQIEIILDKIKEMLNDNKKD